MSRIAIFILKGMTGTSAPFSYLVLKVCYVPATSAGLPRLLFLLRPLTVLMKQTRQVVRAIGQSILLRCLWFETSRGI
jgi:hypothetical protein